MDRQETWETEAGQPEDLVGTSGAAPGSRPGPGAQDETGQTSGGMIDGTQLEALVDRRARALVSEEIARLRHDLDTDIERRVQSFSDRTAHRLTQQQTERLASVDATLESLRDALGPDFEQYRRQARVDALLAMQSQTGQPDTTQAPETAPAVSQQPQAQQTGAVGGPFAQQYLTTKLGNPTEWTETERTDIERQLSEARDFADWLAVVDRYAGRRSGAGLQITGQQAQQQVRGNAARANPGAGGGAPGGADLATLNRQYNAAAADGDRERMVRLGEQIDRLLANQLGG